MIKTILKNVKESYNHLPYTWKHYRSFLKVEKAILGEYKYKFHDWDKMFMFIFLPFLGDRIINQWHQKHNRHHPTFTVGKDWTKQVKSQSEVEWVEAIIDWECARYTKPDKPLDAYDTLFKFYPEYVDVAKPFFKELGLWRGIN